MFHFASEAAPTAGSATAGWIRAPAPDGQPPDEWTHDPDRPVPFITDASYAQIGGPDDYSGVQSRGDVLVYTGGPLDEPLEIIGAVQVVAHVATSAADTDVMAKLVDVHPSGFAQRLCDGMVRLRYRSGFRRAEPVTPGEVYEVTIPMWDTCVRLPPGTGCGSRSPRRPSRSSTSTWAPAATWSPRPKACGPSTGSGTPRPGRPGCW